MTEIVEAEAVEEKRTSGFMIAAFVVGIVAAVVCCGISTVFMSGLTVQSAATGKGKPAPAVRATSEQQALRRAALDEYRSSGVIVVERRNPEGTPHVYVNKTSFDQLEFSEKQRLAGMLAAWHYSMASVPTKGSSFSVSEMVVFHDSKTDRRIGSFTPMGGLKLH